MKPDWKDAPEWAMWRYFSVIGAPVWAEAEPRWSWFYGCYKHMGAYTFAAKPLFTFYPDSRAAIKKSLTKRPTTTDPDARPGSEGQGA